MPFCIRLELGEGVAGGEEIRRYTYASRRKNESCKFDARERRKYFGRNDFLFDLFAELFFFFWQKEFHKFNYLFAGRSFYYGSE